MAGWVAFMEPRENTPLHLLAAECTCNALGRLLSGPRGRAGASSAIYWGSAAPSHRDWCALAPPSMRLIIRRKIAEQPPTPEGNERRSILRKLLGRMGR